MSQNNAVAPFLQPEKLKTECDLIIRHILHFIESGIVVGLRIFDASVSVLQHLLDLHRLFIFERLSLTLWNVQRFK